MNTIVVGVLAGRGMNPSVMKLFRRLKDDRYVSIILPLFGVYPEQVGGKFLHMPKAAENHRGEARTELLRYCTSTYAQAGLLVLLDDDTEPQPGYFEFLANMALPEGPCLMGGKLFNEDGQRCWDVCSFEDNRPVVVPYDFWDHQLWASRLYLSGPQHIFNKAGRELAVTLGYPPLQYGEDTGFCFNFKKVGGRIKFLPDISAKLMHQHTSPNYPVS